jgi:mono/diheme cytochrome c family protein
LLLLCAAVAAAQAIAAGQVDADATGTPRVNARPLRDYTLERTPQRLARGEYLAEGLLQCFVCHSERDWNAPGAPPVAGRKGAGKVFRDDGKSRLVAPNITPDRETGAGGWTDDMLARAIREGVGHDGRALHPQMWYSSFRALSDEDLASVIVYLRSIPPVRNALAPTRLTPDELASIASEPEPLLDSVQGPDPADALARGRYLVHVADCEGCHTSWYSERMPGVLAGGNEITRDGHAAFSTNITPHASGASYDAAGFIQIIRTGKGGTLSGLMPWIVFRNLDDADLTAIHGALRRVMPVQHWISNHAKPTHCAVCGQEHGLGEANVLEPPPAAAAIDHALYDDYAGQYRNEEYGETLTIVRAGDRLEMRDAGGEAIELIPRSDTEFLAPGALAPVGFVRDGSGRVARLLSHEVEDVAFERLDETAGKAGN